MTEPTLLPCPFCGSKNIDSTGWMDGEHNTGPVCDDCEASAESVEAWNRRPAEREGGLRQAVEDSRADVSDERLLELKLWLDHKWNRHKEEEDLEAGNALGELISIRRALASPAKEPKGCVCGEPSTPNVLHRKDGPCYQLSRETMKEQTEYAAEMAAASDGTLWQIWRDSGGTFHGPNVEHGSMREDLLLPFHAPSCQQRPPVSKEGAVTDNDDDICKHVPADEINEHGFATCAKCGWRYQPVSAPAAKEPGVRRYVFVEWDDDGIMARRCEDVEGDYVHVADYDALAAQVDEQRRLLIDSSRKFEVIALTLCTADLSIHDLRELRRIADQGELAIDALLASKAGE